MTKKGFTLIELMIVLAIVAILVAVSVPSLLRSRMAANESAAIGACKTFCAAQEIYRRTDWDGDGFLEYSRNIGPNGARGNGESLYLNVSTNQEIALVTFAFARAEGAPGAGNVTPMAGYCFDIQMGTSWPINRSFLDNTSNLMAGYGLSAVPLQYNISGVNKFQISSAGVVYQSDTGDNTHNATFDINPANNWAATE